MKILNFGSLNIDHVYSVEQFVRPGETISALGYQRFPGGKGLNQSTALARAGVRPFHAGRIGAEGSFLLDYLRQAGADTAFVTTGIEPTGHAIIQVNTQGENAIIVHGGANRTVSEGDTDTTFKQFGAGDYLLLQNEISAIPAIMTRAAKKGMRIVFNPSPLTPQIMEYPLETVGLFLVNEIEGAQISGEKEPDTIINTMRKKYPQAAVVLTLGSKGARYCDDTQRLTADAINVKPVDTTAAGDTFTGYFLAGLIKGDEIAASLRIACTAAALCVTRKGAAGSIPSSGEVIRFSA